MKALKISLAIIVVGAIGAGILFWIQGTIIVPPVKPPENQFIARIEQEIEQLKAKPDNTFCKDFYKEIAHNINVFYEQNRFGSNQSENNQWKENFEKTLYSVYAEKFINQAKTVFRGSQWSPEDLRFIQAEKNELNRSRFLSAGSPVNQELATIQSVLDQYNEIESFISSCRSFNFSGTALSDRFPIEAVQSKIQRVASLRSNRLGNVFVNNCSRLHIDLNEIPPILFRAHVRYLDSKISYWSDMYSHYNSQSDYANNLYLSLIHI